MGRQEKSVAEGVTVAVEVRGAADADKLASRGLALAAAEVARALVGPREPKLEDRGYAGIIGTSEPMREVFRMLDRIRTSHATVLITGENGTGKELVAKAIHKQSSRAQKRFVATNCSAFNDNLLESELFGHKRGAFTGASADKPGLFEVADGGTFFLDEVGDMSPALQVKVLRVLQEGIFHPVGATESRKVDVRIVAATNRDLATMIKQGTFREDLFYRLNVVHLRVPALRERRGDIALLIDFFLERLGKREKSLKVLSDLARSALLAHAWPGNVRELENEIERLWVLSGDDAVISEDLVNFPIPKPLPSASLTPVRSADVRVTPGADATSGATDAAPAASSLPAAVEALERRMILDALRRANGNKTRASDELGISRRNLIRKVQAFGLDVPDDRSGGDDEGDA